MSCVLLGLQLPVPDHTTLLAGAAAASPVGSRGCQRHKAASMSCWTASAWMVFGQGEWNASKHGRARRRWRKLHHCRRRQHG